MIGLFQENGPCHFVNGDSTPSLNPYSWNSVANMLYIDQPIGTGFSYGDDQVTSTVTAAPFVWQLLQAFYAQFPQYESRNFGIFTESYGGHYGPEFADYIEQQNAAITAGSVQGQQIKLTGLGINNGWFDANLQEPAYADFSYNNSYKPMISASDHAKYLDAYRTQCAPALAQCRASGSDSDCQASDSACYNAVEGPLSSGTANGGVASYDFDVYDIRQPSNDAFPPKTYSTYLTDPTVVKAIGARSAYQECPNGPYQKFASTGDNSRPFLSQLSDVVKSGVQTVVWAGDADWICNWFGGRIAADAVTFGGQAAFQGKDLAPYTVRGAHGGDFKQQDNFGFLRVFGAGHGMCYLFPRPLPHPLPQAEKKIRKERIANLRDCRGPVLYT